MTDALILLRVMVGCPDGDSSDWCDETLNAYLYIAERKILSRMYPFGVPNDAALPEKYLHLQCEIACYLLNKRGAEGQISHSENGVSRSYESASVPESMLAEVTPYCGVPI